MPIIIGAAINTTNATYEAEIHIECSCQLGSGFGGACNHPESTGTMPFAFRSGRLPQRMQAGPRSLRGGCCSA